MRSTPPDRFGAMSTPVGAPVSSVTRRRLLYLPR